jgi:hypothetical protein
VQILNQEGFWITAFADTFRGSWGRETSKNYSECPELDDAFESFGILTKYLPLMKDEGKEKAFVNEIRIHPFQGIALNRLPWESAGADEWASQVTPGWRLLEHLQLLLNPICPSQGH